MQTADLGQIVTYCELAELDLMDEGNHKPTNAEIGEAAKFWAAEVKFDDRDLLIVIAHMGLGNRIRKSLSNYAAKYAPVGG